MNQNKRKIFVTSAVLCLMATAAVIFGVLPGTVSAQSGSVFTMTPAFNVFGVLNGVVIVDQSTGAVSVCTSRIFANPNTPSNGTCQLRARVRPGSGTSSLTVTTTNGSVFILNNESGQILECTTFGSVDCISHGDAGR
jgi:hypothetical protein